MTKAHALAALKAEMEKDRSLQLTTNLIFGEGNPDAEVLFVGEAPGRTEDEGLRPFIGKAGKLLRSCILELNWNEEDVYITNIVKRRPPENRDPTPEEIASYQPYLTKQIEIIDPAVIVPLGRFAMNYFLPEAKITRDQGKAFIYIDQNGTKRIIYPVFHPAATWRATKVMQEFKESLSRLPLVLREAKEL